MHTEWKGKEKLNGKHEIKSSYTGGNYVRIICRHIMLYLVFGFIWRKSKGAVSCSPPIPRPFFLVFPVLILCRVGSQQKIVLTIFFLQKLSKIFGWN